MAVTASEVQRFNPNDHITQIKTNQGPKDYLPVQWRLVWFRSACPEGSIETEMIHMDFTIEFTEEVWEKGKKFLKTAPGFAIFRAIVKDGKGGVASGTKSEKAATFPDFIEKAETGAIGRALAALGYGTQFTGDEWDEAHRIVDSPVGTNEQTPNPSDMARRGEEEMSQLRARVQEVKPQNKQGVMSFAQFYENVTKTKYRSDRDVSVAQRKAMNDQLDVIVRMRKNPAEETPAAS